MVATFCETCKFFEIIDGSDDGFCHGGTPLPSEDDELHKTDEQVKGDFVRWKKTHKTTPSCGGYDT